MNAATCTAALSALFKILVRPSIPAPGGPTCLVLILLACVLVDVSVTCLTGDSAMRSRGEDMRDLVEALLRDVEMRKMRNPRIEAATRARNAVFVPFVLSSNGALGARANVFLKQVFWFVKKGAAWHAQFPSTAGIYLTYQVLRFLAAVNRHGCYGDERFLRRQGPSS